MKELDSFTVERLGEIKNAFLDCHKETAPSIGEIFALIDIALAAKRAEPAVIFNEPDSLSYRNLIGNFPVGTKFYTTPPLPAEPVAYADRQAFENFRNGKATKEWMWADPDSGLIALYTTPQLNSQAGLGSWIKCSDRMPEDDTLCLGVDECGVIWTMHFDDGEFRADTGDVDDLKISHWMPLPDAPEKPV